MLPVLFKFRPNAAFDVAVALEYAGGYIIGGGPLTYTGSVVNNTEVEFNAITWTDGRISKPSWSDVQTYWLAWRATYFSASFDMEDINQFWNEHISTRALSSDMSTALSAKADSSALAAKADSATMTTALAAKADSSALAAKADSSAVTTALSGKANSSHSHAQSDITNLVTDLSGKASSSHTHIKSDVTDIGNVVVDLKAAGMAFLRFKGVTDSNGELKVIATNTGLTSGAALFNLSDLTNDPVVAQGVGFGNTATDTNAPHMFIDRWEDSGKTAVLKATQGHTQVIVLAANTDVADFVSSGKGLEGTLYGKKA